jgi:hypothetical protein
MANDHLRRSALGRYRIQRNGLRNDRHSPHAGAKRVPNTIRGLGISCSVAHRSVRNAVAVGIRGAFRHASGVVWGRRRGSAVLFVGIHNAWDSVVYHVFVKDRDRNERR